MKRLFIVISHVSIPVKSYLVVIVGTFCILCGCSTDRATIVDGDTTVPQIIISTELAYVSQADKDAVRKEVQSAFQSILPVLGIQKKDKIEITIVESGICKTEGRVIFLPISHIKDNSAAVIHEITHTVANHGDNSFFSEGLAVYFQNKVGNVSGFPNYTVSLDDLMRNYQGRLMDIKGLMADNEIFSRVGTEDRKIAYIEAGSFINFLVARYGEKKLRELHNSQALSYKAIYGIKVEELAAEWKKYVFEEFAEK